jgi:DNA-directed RNA polymerase subunit RPC12/RpoP
MELTNCPNPNCGAPLPGIGNVCSKCRTQFKCANKKCNELIVLGEDICLYCGQEVLVMQKKADSKMNTLEYNESITKKGSRRSLRTSFSDTVGTNIATPILQILSNSKVTAKTGKPISNGQQLEIPETQDIDYQEEPTEAPKVLEAPKILEAPTIPDPEMRQLLEVFRIDGEAVSLKDTELKAKTKKDYFIRLTCLFLYLRSLQGVEKVPRQQVTELMRKSSLLDGNYNSWIADEQILLHGTRDEVELRTPGSTLAKKVLIDRGDATIPNGWQLGTVKNSSRKKGKTKGKKEEGGDDV